MKPIHMISTALFIIALIVSIIGPYTEGLIRAFMWVWTVLLLISGWTIHIIGIVKK